MAGKRNLDPSVGLRYQSSMNQPPDPPSSDAVPRPRPRAAGSPAIATAAARRAARLKAALKANMARRKAQARARADTGDTADHENG